MPSNLAAIGDPAGVAGVTGGLHHGLPSSGSMGNLAGMQGGLPLPGMAPGLMGSGGDLHMMSNAAAAAMMMAAAHAAHGGPAGSPGGPQGGLAAARGTPIKLGRGVTDPACYQHKLFIGQIPYEVGRGAWRTRAAAARAPTPGSRHQGTSCARSSGLPADVRGCLSRVLVPESTGTQSRPP